MDSNSNSAPHPGEIHWRAISGMGSQTDKLQRLYEERRQRGEPILRRIDPGQDALTATELR
jgi:hypothetical protein